MSKSYPFGAPKKAILPALTVMLLSCGQQTMAQTPTSKAQPSKISILDAVDNIQVAGVRHTHKVPTNFPLPIYQSNVSGTHFTNTTEGIPMASLVIATHDDVQTVVNWYKQQCSSQGWTIKSPKDSAKTTSEKTGSVYLMQGQKGSERAIITCAKGKKGFETTVNITWQKHP